MESVLYKRLDVKSVFQTLDEKDKWYAYHMSRAAWFGTRIIFRQVSPESSDIFDLIITLYRSCKGNWESLLSHHDLTNGEEQLECFLQYAALFLSNMGNYYGQGDQKIVPHVSRQFLETITSTYPETKNLANRCLDVALAPAPGHLGFPGPNTQSGYYPILSSANQVAIRAEEVKAVSKLMAEKGTGVENTRVQKSVCSGKVVLTVLQASTDTSEPEYIAQVGDDDDAQIFLTRGDHAQELARVNEALLEASKYCANENRARMLDCLQSSFRTGNLESYKDSQRIWVKDLGPKVEVIFGFLEAYRDPHGSRAEFEGVVSILDPEGSKALQQLCDRSGTFIAKLPWVTGIAGDDYNGPFESDLFEAPEFTAVHALTYSSTMIYLGINVPNFEDIRQNVGHKNIFIANRHQPLDKDELLSEKNAPFLTISDREPYLLRFRDMENLNIAIHELLGHGTGKLLSESHSGQGPNLDVSNPPINPLTNKAVDIWYKEGETYNAVFGDIATSMEECRAECVGAFLIFEKELAAIFGYTDSSAVKLDDLIYDLYLHRGVLGLQSLQQYDPESQKWGQAHARGNFAIFKALLDSDGFMKLETDQVAKKAILTIDESKLLSHGRKAIENLLLHIHIYRCTADVQSARRFYNQITAVDSYWLNVREIVDHHQSKKEAFVQANVSLRDGIFTVQEYEKSSRGLIQSWAERCDLLQI